jgi:uncharacterized membrane protein YfcA
MFTPVVILMFAAFGSFAGFLAGLLGIGGGVILVPLFLWAFAQVGFSDTFLVHVAIGTSLTIIFPTTVSSTLSHFRNGHVNPTQVMYLSLGAVAGALCGSTFATFVDGDVLKGLFGLMQIGVATKILLPVKILHMEPDRMIPPRNLILVGLVAGTFSAFFGVGGGVIAVPMMLFLLHLPIHKAVGNSSAMIVLSSIIGALAYVFHGWSVPQLPDWTFGYVNLLVVAIVAPFTIIAARFGARLADRFERDKLMQIFALLLIAVGLRLLIPLFLAS